MQHSGNDSETVGEDAPVLQDENVDVNLLSTKITLTDPKHSTDHPEVYRIRWLMLVLFFSFNLSSGLQWIHLNIIANIIVRYYNQSLPEDTFQRETAIDWLSMSYMLAYIVLVIPATWILDRKGLRLCHILGSFLNCLGAWLKCASVSPDRFALLMFAQWLCACAQMWAIGIPARLAAVWFGPNEVSTATSIGVLGNQVGTAIGFLLPPEVVPNSDNIDDVGRDLGIMLYGNAGSATLLFVLILIFFRDKPPKPPSGAQIMAEKTAIHGNYLKSLLTFFKNPGFVILMISYGINAGSYYALSTLLNAVILEYFEGEEQSAGRVGLTIVLAGVLGSILTGIWMDKTKTFKATSLGIYILSMAFMVTFTFIMSVGQIWIVFLTSGVLGFFMTGYLPVGFEFAVEITYPESEGTSSGLLNASAQLSSRQTTGDRELRTSIAVN